MEYENVAQNVLFHRQSLLNKFNMRVFTLLFLV
jgi:hypothetical protein